MAQEPKLIAVVPRSATEQMQISINEYKGKAYLDLRIHYTTDDGQTWLPTKKGRNLFTRKFRNSSRRN